MNSRGFVFLLSLSLCLQATAGDTIYRNVGIRFSYHPAIFPEAWREAPILARGSRLSNSEEDRCTMVTVRALSKYPVDLLRLNLQRVYWLRDMNFFGVGYGGTNSTHTLYLTNDGVDKGYTDNYLEQTFHHEFSSILFRNYSSAFDSLAWRAANDPAFSYNDPEEGVGAIRNNASSQDFDTLLCKMGVLTQYAESSLENDANTFAQHIFSNSKEFWALADRYPRVRRKTQLLITFYQKINPIFTESYFRNFSGNQH